MISIIISIIIIIIIILKYTHIGNYTVPISNFYNEYYYYYYYYFIDSEQGWDATNLKVQ